MTPDDLNSKLLEYLEDGKRSRVSEASKLDQLIVSHQHMANNQSLMERKVDMLGSQMQEQMKGVNARIAKLEDAAEDTGSHNISLLQEKLKEQKEVAAKEEAAVAKALEEEKAKSSRVLGYVIAAMGALCLLGLGGAISVVGYLITHPVIGR